MRESVHVRSTRRRAEARRRVAAQVAVPMAPETRAFDPHARDTSNPAVALAITLALSFGVHAAVIFFRWSLGPDEIPKPKEVKIEVRPPPEPPPPPPPPEPKVAETPKPPEPAPPPPKKAPPPPPPKAEPPPPPPSAPPPRRITGLSLESTTEGGDGPSFSTGNTNVGETATKAVDPKTVDPRGASGTPDGNGPPPPPGPNKVATNLPGNATVRVPKRKAPITPPYPALLRAQEIEADVVLLVSIDTTGKVTSVKVLVPAAQAEFNDAAVAAAKSEQYEPATRDGTPIP